MAPVGGSPAAEVDIDEGLVRALLAEQHPDVADLPLEPLAEGWDNVLFRLGDELTVRLPRRLMSAALVEHEQRWLPELAPRLPLPVPVPVRAGRPSEALGYPWPWSVCPWLPGEPAEDRPPDDLDEAAETLGGFIAAMHQPAPSDAPANPYRGIPLHDRTDWLEAGLEALSGEVDTAAVQGCWSDLLDTPPWPGPALWLHGDVHPLNVLVHEGRIAGVIDFGDLCAGDPASDLAVAWMMFDPPARTQFRHASGADEDTWRRGRGWALALGVAMANGGERVATFGRRAIAAALEDGA